MAEMKKRTCNKRRAAVLACIIAGVTMAFLYGLRGESVIGFLKGMVWGNSLIIVVTVFSCLSLAELIWRIVLVIKYQPLTMFLTGNCRHARWWFRPIMKGGRSLIPFEAWPQVTTPKIKSSSLLWMTAVWMTPGTGLNRLVKPWPCRF